jgi:hypothetical protein
MEEFSPSQKKKLSDEGVLLLDLKALLARS